MIKVVVFDFDGTLVDSDAPIVKGFQQAFIENNLPKPSKRRIFKYVGLRAEDWADALLYDLQVTGDPVKIGKRTLYLVEEFFSKTGKPMSSCIATLKKLKKQNTALAIISNDSSRNLHHVLTQLNLLQFFGEVIGVDQMPAPKPHPLALKKLLKKINVKPSECIYVGDTEIDQAFAQQSGVKFALLKNTRNREVSADYKLRRLSDLLQVVNQC